MKVQVEKYCAVRLIVALLLMGCFGALAMVPNDARAEVKKSENKLKKKRRKAFFERGSDVIRGMDELGDNLIWVTEPMDELGEDSALYRKNSPRKVENKSQKDQL